MVKIQFYLCCRIDVETTSGKNREASPPFRMMSLTMVEAMEVYFGSQVRKKVSI